MCEIISTIKLLRICRREFFNKSVLIDNEMKMLAKNILQLIVVKLETFLVTAKERQTSVDSLFFLRWPQKRCEYSQDEKKK